MRHRSCVCNKNLHNYTVYPATGPRRVDGICCSCPEDCLCHGTFTTRIPPDPPRNGLKGHLVLNPRVSGEGDS